MAGLMTRLLLVVVLSCLIPTAVSSEACEAGTTGVSATCGIVSAILGFLGALLCGATAGAACAPAFAGVAAVAGVCSTAVGVVPCGGDDMEQILGLLTTMRYEIEELRYMVEYDFFEYSYANDIDTIQNAAEQYRTLVLGSNYDEYHSSRWVQKMETFYDVANALIEVEDMIGGTEFGSSARPSVYEISRRNGLCSESLYQLMVDLLVEGTSLEAIHLEMVGQELLESQITKLTERLLLNDRMYNKYCRLNLPIEAFRIKISSRSYSSTSGNLKIGVKQGDDYSCETDRYAFPDSSGGQEYILEDKALFGTCRDLWFEHLYNSNDLKIKIGSDSRDDAYLDEAGIKIDGIWRNWVGYELKVDHNTGNEWRTVIPAVDPLNNSGFTASQSSTSSNGLASRAIDGNTSGSYSVGTCTHTGAGPGAWWRVDLDQPYQIFKVVIYNRVDCCEDRIDGAEVYAMDGEFEIKCGTLHYESGKDVYDIECDMATTNMIKIVLPSNNPLTLCEVKLYGEPVGLRQIDTSGLTATQSSTSSNGAPNRAIDGNTSGNYRQSSCTHTGGDGNQWWRVDLGRAWDIYKVVIHNRNDCCENRIDGAKVFAVLGTSRTECGEIDYQSGIDIYEIRCGTNGIEANRIQIEKSGIITLCEVELYGI